MGYTYAPHREAQEILTNNMQPLFPTVYSFRESGPFYVALPSIFHIYYSTIVTRMNIVLFVIGMGGRFLFDGH
jgi:hypothetical protein